MPKPTHHSRVPLPRSVQISKSLSRLLRHAAVQDRVPIDSHGYIRVDHVLNWQRLRSLQPKVRAVDIVIVVEVSEKGRFGLLYSPQGIEAVRADSEVAEAEVGLHEIALNGISSKDGCESQEVELPPQKPETVTNGHMTSIQQPAVPLSATQNAISIFDSGVDTDPAHYFIRATQGHSMTVIDPLNLLTPITLASLSGTSANGDSSTTSIPDLVVHGTFYSSYSHVLKDGALKCMGRNHIHFATGPSLSSVLEAQEIAVQSERGIVLGNKSRIALKDLMQQGNVKSGMRPDAEVLIYVDLRRSLQAVEPAATVSSTGGAAATSADAPPEPQQPQHGTQVEGEHTAGRLKWFRSENNVVLTSGLDGKMPMEYWEVVVEVKRGLGVVWRRGEGVVKEIPRDVREEGFGGGRGAGRGREGGGRGARGGKPRLRVERDDLDGSGGNDGQAA